MERNLWEAKLDLTLSEVVTKKYFPLQKEQNVIARIEPSLQSEFSLFVDRCMMCGHLSPVLEVTYKQFNLNIKEYTVPISSSYFPLVILYLALTRLKKLTTYLHTFLPNLNHIHVCFAKFY